MSRLITLYPKSKIQTDSKHPDYILPTQCMLPFEILYHIEHMGERNNIIVLLRHAYVLCNKSHLPNVPIRPK